MTQNDFARVCQKALDAYLREIAESIRSGNFSSDIAAPIFSYPTHLIIGAASGYLFLELVGASKGYTPLAVKYTKPESIYSFLGQVDYGDAMVSIEADHITLSHLLLQTNGNGEALLKRFPQSIIVSYKSQIRAKFEAQRVFEFGRGMDYFCLEDLILLNNHGKQFRLRNPLLVIVVSNKINRQELEAYFKQEFSITPDHKLRIVKAFNGRDSDYMNICIQFYNLYLRTGIHETLLGDFLTRHEDILLKTLGGTHLVPKPRLEWQIKAGQEEAYIEPDFMIKRKDGFYDICDLKLPLLSKKALTTGTYRSRSFIASINQGLSQIAGYRDYFSHEENRKYALQKYGIKVNSPALTLIVGNYENYNDEFVRQAQRAYSEMRVIDYDTLINTYRLKILKK